MPSDPVDHRKTCHRYNDPGHAHALTFSCFHRQRFLSGDRSRQWFIDAVDRARVKHHFHVWAYVTMPEHVHLLIWPTIPDYNISEILNSIKQSVSNRLSCLSVAKLRHFWSGWKTGNQTELCITGSGNVAAVTIEM